MAPTTTQAIQDDQLIYARVPALHKKGAQSGIHLFNVNSQNALPRQTISSQECPTLPRKSPNQLKSKATFCPEEAKICQY